MSPEVSLGVPAGLYFCLYVCWAVSLVSALGPQVSAGRVNRSTHAQKQTVLRGLKNSSDAHAEILFVSLRDGRAGHTENAVLQGYWGGAIHFYSSTGTERYSFIVLKASQACVGPTYLLTGILFNPRITQYISCLQPGKENTHTHTKKKQHYKKSAEAEQQYYKQKKRTKIKKVGCLLK